MSRDKQIEEMAKQLYGNFGLSMPTARNVATYLTEKKGYRKASEVAREIFEEIERLLDFNALQGDIFTGRYFSDELEADIAELKNKYTENKGE